MSSSTSYGATGSNHTRARDGQGHEDRLSNTHANDTQNADVDAETALLSGNGTAKASSYNRSMNIRPYLTYRIDRTYADLILLGCYFTTGLLDSAATVIWGAFVSMQTGNSIYVGLGLTDPSGGDRWIKSALSIACFSLGSFLFSRLHRVGGGSMRRRWVLLLSSGLQFIMICAAAIIIRFTPTPTPGDRHDLHWHVLVPLGLIAGQSAGQTVTSRALEFNALTSTVLTSIYCDLFADQKLFTAPTANVDRNRRGAAPVLLILGAVTGGLCSRHEIGLEGALWMAAGLKGLIVVAWIVWKAEKEDEDN